MEKKHILNLEVNGDVLLKENQLVFTFSPLHHTDIEFSIPDTIQDFYLRRNEISDSNISFASDVPDTLISHLELGGGLIDDQIWYLTWSLDSNTTRERSLMTTVDALKGRIYQIETKSIFVYVADVTNAGDEASKRLFVNGKRMESRFDPKSKLWFHPHSFGSFKELIDLGKYYIRCCPAAIFNR